MWEASTFSAGPDRLEPIALSSQHQPHKHLLRLSCLLRPSKILANKGNHCQTGIMWVITSKLFQTVSAYKVAILTSQWLPLAIPSTHRSKLSKDKKGWAVTREPRLSDSVSPWFWAADKMQIRVVIRSMCYITSPAAAQRQMQGDSKIVCCCLL